MIDRLMTRKIHWPAVALKLAQCMRDEAGTVMAEYLLITAITLPVACYLFHPDNGFYQMMRNQYNLTFNWLMLPAP